LPRSVLIVLWLLFLRYFLWDRFGLLLPCLRLSLWDRTVLLHLLTLLRLSDRFDPLLRFLR